MLNDNVKYNTNKIIKYRDFSKSNVQKFSASLRSINWDFVESANNTQHSYELFHETFFALYNLYFPLLSKSCNKNNHGFHPWMTKGLLISRSKKLSLQLAPKFLSGTKLPLYAVACNMRPCGQWGCIKGSLRNAEGENFLSKTKTFRLAGI